MKSLPTFYFPLGFLPPFFQFPVSPYRSGFFILGGGEGKNLGHIFIMLVEVSLLHTHTRIPLFVCNSAFPILLLPRSDNVYIIRRSNWMSFFCLLFIRKRYIIPCRLEGNWQTRRGKMGERTDASRLRKKKPDDGRWGAASWMGGFRQMSASRLD